MKIPMRNFQVYDALSIHFKLEKPPLEHFEGFILLPIEGGELQITFRTLNQKLQFKTSKEFPQWINKKLVHQWWEKCL
jgi:hypothetical protein